MHARQSASTSTSTDGTSDDGTSDDGESPECRARTDGPSTVRTRDDRAVAYAEYGDPAGRPVLFFHGTPGSRLLGRLFDEAARTRGVRVLAPDRPGYGHSEPWPDRTAADAERWAVPVLDDAGVERCGVVAFSGGAPHALALAATTDRVTSVDLVSGGVPASFLDDQPTGQRLLGALAAVPPVFRGLARLQAWLAARRDPSFVLAQYTSGGETPIPDDVAALVGRDFREALGESRAGFATEGRQFTRDWPLVLSHVDLPVRLWHGERDANVPISGARRLQEALPDAELREFDGEDHLTALLRAREAVLSRHAGSA